MQQLLKSQEVIRHTQPDVRHASHSFVYNCSSVASLQTYAPAVRFEGCRGLCDDALSLVHLDPIKRRHDARHLTAVGAVLVDLHLFRKVERICALQRVRVVHVYEALLRYCAQNLDRLSDPHGVVEQKRVALNVQACAHLLAATGIANKPGSQ